MKKVKETSMYKYIGLSLLVASSMSFAADTSQTTKAPTTDIDKLSYSLGAKTAESLREQELNVNPQLFYQGMTDVYNKKTMLMTDEQMREIITKVQKQQMSKIAAMEAKISSENLAKSKEFLDKNKKNSDVKTTASGLQYIELVPGNGQSPKISDQVTVNYRGTLIDGTEFDSSYSRNESSTFPLENLIPGWQEALTMMKPGSKWKLFVPPNLAYGDKGAGNVIPPNSLLIFEIELVDVKSK